MKLDTSLKAVVALTLALVGSVATYNMWVPRDRRVGPEWLLGPFVLLGPVLLAAGAVLSILCLAAVARSGPGKPDNAPRWILRLGLALLLVGGFPWAYTPLVFGPDKEQSSGMMGTIIFLLVGMPGLAVTVIGASLGKGRRCERSEGRAPEDR